MSPPPRLTKDFETARQPVPVIRASILALVVDAVAGAGQDAGALLARHGVRRPRAADHYSVVPLGRYVALFEDAAAALDEPFLGLELAQALKPEELGPLGLIFVLQPTLEAALRSFARYLTAVQNRTVMTLRLQDGRAECEYRIDDPGIWPRRQDAEFTMANLCALIRRRLGPGWRPVEVGFEHAPPLSGAERLGRYFGVPARFQQPANRLALDLPAQERPGPPGNAGLVEVLERHLADLIGDTGAPLSLSGAVGEVLRRGDGTSLHAVAAAMGLVPRSLQRRLEQEGTSFRLLLREYRRRTAESLLRDGGPSVKDISRQLGYADAAVLSRAFKGWTGMAPGRMRRPR